MSGSDTPPGATDTHGDGHGHAVEPTLGPIDWEAWAYAIAGTVLGALVALALYVARGS